MAQHAAQHAPPHQASTLRHRGPLDEQTVDLAECIETSIGEVIGDSRLLHAVSVHAARGVQLWIDYQLQRGTLRPTVTTMVDVESTGEIPGVCWRSDAAPTEPAVAIEATAPGRPNAD